MKWYTLRWQDVSEGCTVEHFLKKETAIRREGEVKQISNFEQSFGITEIVVKNNKELVDWLNHFYTSENG